MVSQLKENQIQIRKLQERYLWYYWVWTLVRHNQALENYLELSVGDNVLILRSYNRDQFTDTAVIKTPKAVGIF